MGNYGDKPGGGLRMPSWEEERTGYYQCGVEIGEDGEGKKVCKGVPSGGCFGDSDEDRYCPDGPLWMRKRKGEKDEL